MDSGTILNNEFFSKFHEGYSDIQILEESWRAQSPKYYDNNKDEDIRPNVKIIS